MIDRATGEILAPLTDAERAAFVEREAIIQARIRNFIDVGTALMDIRDHRLYRDDYDTFEAYCRERWGFVASRARQLISAAELTLEIATTVTLPNERTARALLSFPEAARPVIAAAAQAQAEAFSRPLTAGIIEAVGDVVMQAVTTGAIDVNGEATALQGALSEAVAETLQRRQQHINDRRAELRFTFEGLCLSDLPANVAAALQRQGAGALKRVIVVTEKPA